MSDKYCVFRNLLIAQLWFLDVTHWYDRPLAQIRKYFIVQLKSFKLWKSSKAVCVCETNEIKSPDVEIFILT